MPDKLGPIEIEFVLDKQADEQAKKLKASLDAVGTSSKKSVADLKVFIKEQQALIKSMEGDIKRIEDLFTPVTPMAKNKGLIAELSRMKEELAREQGKLNELQNQGTQQDEKEVVSKNKIISVLGKWVAGLFTVGAALKVAKDIIASTEGSAHTFEVVVAEATAGVGYFFKAIASGDWSNFWEGLKNAIKGAKDYVDAMEIITNRQNEQKIKSAEISSQIAELRAGTFDRDIENSDKLITNLTQIIALQKQDYLAQAETAKDIYEVALKAAADKNGINKDTLDFLISEYIKTKEIIELGEEYNKKQDALNTIRSLQPNAKIIPELEKEIIAMGKAGEAAGGMALKYGKVPILLRTSLASLKVEQIKLEGLAKIGSKFDERSLATAENLKKKKAIEDAKIKNQIIAQQELLDKAIEKGNTAEIKAIGERIRKLQEELVLRERIAEAAIAATMTRETPITALGRKTGSLLNARFPNIKIPPFGAPIKTPNILAGYNPPYSAEYIKDLQKRLAQEQKITNEERAQKELMSDMIPILGEQLGLNWDQMRGLEEILATWEKINAKVKEGTITTQDYISGAVTMLQGLLSLFPSQSKEFLSAMDKMNGLLAEQARLIELSKRTGGQEELLKGNVDLLKKQKAAQEEELRKDKQWWRPVKDKKATIAALNAEIEKTNGLIQEASFAYDDFMRGGITENTIADSIAQGFRDGKASVDDFADYMNNILLDALMNIFKQKLLDDPAMQAWMKEANKVINDPNATQAQRDQLKADYIAFGKKYAEDWKKSTIGLIDNGTTSDNSLSGAIKGITEETASVLAGQVNNIRISQALSAGIMRQQLMHLAKIETNTAHLISIDNKLSALGKTDSLRAQGML